MQDSAEYAGDYRSYGTRYGRAGRLRISMTEQDKAWQCTTVNNMKDKAGLGLAGQCRTVQKKSKQFNKDSAGLCGTRFRTV
jgi:hypothetical protein